MNFEARDFTLDYIIHNAEVCVFQGILYEQITWFQNVFLLSEVAENTVWLRNANSTSVCFVSEFTFLLKCVKNLKEERTTAVHRSNSGHNYGK